MNVNIFTISDVIIEIFSYLDNKSLKLCSTLNSKCNEIFKYLLFKRSALCYGEIVKCKSKSTTSKTSNYRSMLKKNSKKCKCLYLHNFNKNRDGVFNFDMYENKDNKLQRQELGVYLNNGCYFNRTMSEITVFKRTNNYDMYKCYDKHYGISNYKHYKTYMKYKKISSQVVMITDDDYANDYVDNYADDDYDNPAEIDNSDMELEYKTINYENYRRGNYDIIKMDFALNRYNYAFFINRIKYDEETYYDIIRLLF